MFKENSLVDLEIARETVRLLDITCAATTYTSTPTNFIPYLLWQKALSNFR